LDRRTPRDRSAALPNRVPAARFSGASVTLAGAPLVLEEDCDDEIPWGELRIELVDFKQKNRVSAERLEHGVLIGRYDRCGITFTDSTSRVSRVHLLIVRIDNEIWAIDTASTHGLWRGGHKVTAVVLTDPDQLALGNAATVRWRRLGMAAA
jgi:hypothetical protein